MPNLITNFSPACTALLYREQFRLLFGGKPSNELLVIGLLLLLMTANSEFFLIGIDGILLIIIIFIVELATKAASVLVMVVTAVPELLANITVLANL